MDLEFLERYRHKIKSATELREILGGPPRQDTVIMCHGVFDVVHPGHLRHLLSAKSKADILVASLTADRYIDKGIYRPHIPQDLRACNLAAFEFVDYVLIDEYPTPLGNLRLIQPDLFAKGYEYSGSHGHPKETLEEIEAVHAYGGDVVFTPGDIVYSSSKLIDLAPPAIKFEKLMLLMSRAQISVNDLHDALDSLGGRTVHVVGDTIVDSLTQCVMIGGQTKTPTLSVQFGSRADAVGGAGIVAEHLKAAGAEVVLTTLLGDDDHAQFVLRRMSDAGINCRPIVDSNRPTVNKNAIVAGGYRLLKVDTLDNSSISDDQLDTLAESISNTPCDAVVFSDFRHGIFNRRTIPRLRQSIPPGVFKVGDSQVASRWGNIVEFSDFDLITPNEREARFALADQDSGVRSLASRLLEESRCGVLILKMGDRGILTHSASSHEISGSYFVMDSFVDRLVDSVGAGDALLAYSTLTMLATGNPVIASILGNLAAACECECDGNMPVTPRHVREKLLSIEQQIEVSG